MIVERPWFVLLATLPLLWFLLNRHGAHRRSRVALKAFSLSAILLALSEPQAKLLTSRMAVAVLADTSASVTPNDLRRESDLVNGMEAARGPNTLQVIPFAQRPRNAGKLEAGKSWNLSNTVGTAGLATDIEAALREGMASLPNSRVPRLVLITDGNENTGSAARAAWQARLLDVPIDTISLAGTPIAGLRIESATTPVLHFAGERFPIDIVVTSPRRTPAELTLSAGGTVLGSNQVTLEQGSNRLRAHASVAAVGTIELSGAIHAPGIGEVRFTQALNLRRPRALLVSQDPPGADAHLLKTLASAQFEVQRAAAVPADYSGYQIVVLNNLNLQAIPQARKSAVEEFVKRGGGLVVIGGERLMYVDRAAVTQDPLDRALPARLAPPRRRDSTCVVLILDKSSSMEGKKMELARLAALGVLENLRPTDRIGVLIFDDTFEWAVPIRRAGDKDEIARIIAGIRPDGGTQIAPALAEAFNHILPIDAVYKHILLITDGISEEGDSIALAHAAGSSRVTISTVGLGPDVNRDYLTRVATLARGQSHFLVDPSGLRQTLLEDVMAHNGSTALETDIHPVVLRKADILDGVGMESAPSLHGYVRFVSQPGADVVMNARDGDPLLVRWQYGLGRSAVFTSDAKNRWAERWVDWRGFDKFWGAVFRDLLPRAQAGEATARYDSAADELVVDYRLGPHVEEPATIPTIFVFGPQDFLRPLQVEKIAAGAYRGRVRCGHRPGLFRIRPLADSQAFPEVGLWRRDEELSGHDSDEAMLRRLSAFTGGRLNPEPSEIFQANGRTAGATFRFWPPLVALALVLNLIELILRKRRVAHDFTSGENLSRPK